MKFWHIAVKDLRIRVRDRSALVILILMPLVMIVILGSVFNWTATNFQARVAVVDLDRGSVAVRLTRDVFGSQELKDLLVITTVSTEAEARLLVQQNKVGAAIIIPAGFSDGVMAGKAVNISVVGNPEAATQAGVVRNVVESFTSEVARRRLATVTAVGALQQPGVVPPQLLEGAVQAVLTEVSQSGQTSIAGVKTAVQEGLKVPRAIDYYAIGMALLFLIFTSNTGTESMLEEKRQHTMQRVYVTPTSRAQMLAGKMLGVFAVSALQFTIMVIATRLLYRVNWGSSPAAVIILSFATVLAGAGLSTLLAALVRTPEQAGEIGPAVALIYSLLGGSMWPIYNMPSWMSALSRLTFTRWSIDGFTSLMVNGGGVVSVLQPILVCLGMAAAFLLLSTLLLSRSYA
jgi:ABC-2 type transport system permease protein